MNLFTTSNNISPPSHTGDVGYNLSSSEDTVIRLNEVSLVKTGVNIKLPKDTWAMLVGRSSTWTRRGILVVPGIIDNGYTGEIIIQCMAVNGQVILPAGTSIAQLIMFPMVTPEIEVVDMLPETDRGDKGFGSTG